MVTGKTYERCHTEGRPWEETEEEAELWEDKR
jgi:hypothetical protein